MKKKCAVCGKPLKVGDWQSEDRDDGYCAKCLENMSVNELVDSMELDLEDVLYAFECYPIRGAKK